jgi:DNA polymerase III epsilon subunit-like protein
MWDGHILIGHGLSKDLHALGLEDVAARLPCYDTMTFPGFQGRGGCSKSLKKIAKEILALDIQKQGATHDPEEDARAVMDLFMAHARPKLLTKHEDLVAHYELIIRNGAVSNLLK